jgi:hypothetical protein
MEGGPIPAYFPSIGRLPHHLGGAQHGQVPRDGQAAEISAKHTNGVVLETRT